MENDLNYTLKVPSGLRVKIILKHGMSYTKINQRMCTFMLFNGLQISWANTKLFKIKVGAEIAEHPVLYDVLY